MRVGGPERNTVRLLLGALHEEVHGVVGTPSTDEGHRDSRVICPRFRIGGQLVRTVTVAARFESVSDITLDEIRVELVYPEDEVSGRFFRLQAGPSPD